RRGLGAPCSKTGEKDPPCPVIRRFSLVPRVAPRERVSQTYSDRAGNAKRHMQSGHPQHQRQRLTPISGAAWPWNLQLLVLVLSFHPRFDPKSSLDAVLERDWLLMPTESESNLIACHARRQSRSRANGCTVIR